MGNDHWYTDEELARLLRKSVPEFRDWWARMERGGWVASEPPEYPGGPVRRRLVAPPDGDPGVGIAVPLKPPEQVWQAAVALTGRMEDLWSGGWPEVRDGGDGVVVWLLHYDKHGPDRRDVEVAQRGDVVRVLSDTGHYRQVGA